MLRPNGQGLAAVLRAFANATETGLRWNPKRKKGPILHAARRSATPRCWAALGYGFLVRYL